LKSGLKFSMVRLGAPTLKRKGKISN